MHFGTVGMDSDAYVHRCIMRAPVVAQLDLLRAPQSQARAPAGVVAPFMRVVV